MVNLLFRPVSYLWRCDGPPVVSSSFLWCEPRALIEYRVGSHLQVYGCMPGVWLPAGLDVSIPLPSVLGSHWLAGTMGTDVVTPSLLLTWLPWPHSRYASVMDEPARPRSGIHIESIHLPYLRCRILYSVGEPVCWECPLRPILIPV